jgi:hypothetical protein
MPLVAFCLSHFLADSIICMCVFDFRQAQGSGSAPIGTPVVCQVHELDQRVGHHVARGPTSVLIHTCSYCCQRRFGQASRLRLGQFRVDEVCQAQRSGTSLHQAPKLNHDTTWIIFRKVKER